MIRQALALAELFGKGVVLDDPLTAWTLPDEIAATDSMAIINPRGKVDPDPARPADSGSNIASCALLSEAGVPVAVTPPGGRFGGATVGTGGILGQDLNTLHVDAAFAVAADLAATAAGPEKIARVLRHYADRLRAAAEQAERLAAPPVARH